jgi:hypothetical protein
MAAEALVDPAGQKCPAVQLPLQADDGTPALFPNVPPGQAAHVDARAPLYWPGGQRDAVAFVDPAGQAYPAVQAPLQVDEFKPVAEGSDQAPPGQAVHTAAPDAL